ncbi:MAG: response regulator transcription factor [Synergistaceae bacterium]|nr:response regulator transcription factor [Synergistaceae bacterium]
MAIRILLADDHPLTRSGIAEFVRREPNFELIAEAEDGVEAWNLIKSLRPDVVLLDIRMPEMNGVEVAQKVKAEGLNTAIIMLTSYDAQQYVIASLRAGARGFVLKTVSPKELTTAITTVAKGCLYLDPEVASVMGMDDFSPEPLSTREREVLLLAAQGLSSKEVARRLFISERTVQTHLASIYDKLGSRNKTEALLLALKYGVVTLEELLEDD